MNCRDEMQVSIGDKMRKPSKRIANHESVVAVDQLVRAKLADKLLDALTFRLRRPIQEARERNFCVGQYEDLTSTQAGRLIELHAARVLRSE